MDNSSIKTNIAKLRLEHGLTQTQMAAGVGMSRTAYRKIEIGNTHLINDSVERIASMFGKTTEEIMLGYNPVPGDSKMLSDVMAEYNGRYERLKADHETAVANLLDQVAALRECVEAQKETIRTKDEIIALLRRGTVRTASEIETETVPDAEA